MQGGNIRWAAGLFVGSVALVMIPLLWIHQAPASNEACDRVFDSEISAWRADQMKEILRRCGARFEDRRRLNLTEIVSYGTFRIDDAVIHVGERAYPLETLSAVRSTSMPGEVSMGVRPVVRLKPVPITLVFQTEQEADLAYRGLIQAIMNARVHKSL